MTIENTEDALTTSLPHRFNRDFTAYTMASTAATAATAATSVPRILTRTSASRKLEAHLSPASYAIEWAEEDSLHQEERFYLKYTFCIVGEKGNILLEDHFLYNNVYDQYFLMDSVEGVWDSSADAFVFTFTEKKQEFDSIESLLDEWMSRSLQGFTRLAKKNIKLALLNQYEEEY